MPKTLLALLFVACTALSVDAAGRGLVEVRAEFEPASARAGGVVTLVISANVAPGYHIYSVDTPEGGGSPTEIEFQEHEGLSPRGALAFTPPQKKWDDVFEVMVHYHEGAVEFRQEFVVGEDARAPVAVRGVIHLQACDDNGCVLEDPTFQATLAIGDGATGRSPEPAVPLPEPTEYRSADLGVDVAVRPAEARAGEKVTVQIMMRVAGGRHAYSPDSPAGLPTSLELTAGGKLEAAGALRFPKPEVKYDEVFEEDVHLFHGDVLLEQDFLVPAGTAPGVIALSGMLRGQTCDDSSCTMFDVPLQVGLTVVAGTARPPASATEPTAGAPPPSETPAESSLGAFLALAVFWGVFTLLMPCTYPMIPITISFFTKQAIAREGRVLPLSLAYGAGIVVIFILIGLLLGKPIIAFAQAPLTNLVIGALFFFFALVLFGVIDFQPPRFLMNAAGKASTKGGLVGVFLMGATLVVTSFTCTAPFVGSLLSVGGTTGGYTRIVLGMGVFGLTMALPFVFLSLMPGRMQRMPRAGEWMHVLKVFLGFIELAACLKFVSNADLVWGWGILSREVFLALCMGIMLVAGLFLLGIIKLEGEATERIGSVRMLGGLGSVLMSFYLGLGVLGFEMDSLTTAIIPPYSSERLWTSNDNGTGGGESTRTRHEIVLDDLVAAVESARQQDKLLLINFTGHT